MFRSAEKLAAIAARVGVRDRLVCRSCGQSPVRHGFTLASLCRCGVPSGDFGIGVVTKGSDRPLDEPLWAEIEIEIDEIAACTIAQTLPEPIDDRKERPLTVALATIIMVWSFAFALAFASVHTGANSASWLGAPAAVTSSTGE